MMHVKKNQKKKNNVIQKTSRLVTLAATIILVVVGTTAAIIVPLSVQSAEAQGLSQVQEGDSSTGFINIEGDLAQRKAPAVVSGDNIYIAWWTNNTENGNQEVMFRASNDGGATFGDKMNLSNTTDAGSGRVEIAGEGENVVVSWWETNQTSDIPVARVSNDGGETFGPMMMLGMNGTISGVVEEDAATAEEGEGGEEEASPEGVIEEAVGGVG